MKLQRYNEKKHIYEDYEVSDDWNVKLMTNDMDEIVNCCQCGKEIRFGDCYTSMQVHNALGLGYAVCKNCYYDKEWFEKNKYRKD